MYAWERNFVRSLVSTLICACRLKASYYFIHGFDATNFSERNKNQTM